MEYFYFPALKTRSSELRAFSKLENKNEILPILSLTKSRISKNNLTGSINFKNRYWWRRHLQKQHPQGSTIALAILMNRLSAIKHLQYLLLQLYHIMLNMMRMIAKNQI
ncbi:MAG: hypothetical protein IJ965_06300 [Campylobacter sp.]|nr:hypothetical protein [Campylobacter sp.]